MDFHVAEDDDTKYGFADEEEDEEPVMEISDHHQRVSLHVTHTICTGLIQSMYFP